MTLNPFKYFSDERAKDREALLLAFDKIFEAQRDQNAVAIAQARSMMAFVNAFMNVTGATTRRVATDETEADQERSFWQLHGGES